MFCNQRHPGHIKRRNARRRYNHLMRILGNAVITEREMANQEKQQRVEKQGVGPVPNSQHQAGRSCPQVASQRFIVVHRTRKERRRKGRHGEGSGPAGKRRLVRGGRVDPQALVPRCPLFEPASPNTTAASAPSGDSGGARGSDLENIPLFSGAQNAGRLGLTRLDESQCRLPGLMPKFGSATSSRRPKGGWGSPKIRPEAASQG